MILVLATSLLSACARARSFEPQTMEGARCKMDCLDRASVIPFGASYGTCLEACMDIDRLSKAREVAH